MELGPCDARPRAVTPAAPPIGVAGVTFLRFAPAAFVTTARLRRPRTARARVAFVRFASPVVERFAGRLAARGGRVAFAVRFAGRAAVRSSRALAIAFGVRFAGSAFAGCRVALAVVLFVARDFLGGLARRVRRVVTVARRGAVSFFRRGRAAAVRRARGAACLAERGATCFAAALFALRCFAGRVPVFDPGRGAPLRDDLADFDSAAFTERLFGGDGLRRTPCLRPPRCRGGSRSRGRYPGVFLGFPEASTLITTRAALNEKTGCILSGLRS